MVDDAITEANKRVVEEMRKNGYFNKCPENCTKHFFCRHKK